MRTEFSRPRMINRDGFVMPVVILAIVVLGTMAVAALTTASDEVRSSRAIRESITALYAAESGANSLLATVVDSPSTVLDTLARNMNPGDSVDLGWSTLSNGSAYRGVLYKYSVQAYALNVTGRDVGLRPAEQSISYALKAFLTLPLPAAVSGGAPPYEGDAYAEGIDYVTGLDAIPGWWDAGSCPPLDAAAGITWYEDANINAIGGDVFGSPDIEEDSSIDPFTWGNLDYDMLVGLATITYGGDADITVQPVESGMDCVEHDQNWGDPIDPSGPCAGRFPIVHIGGKLTLRGYGQGIILVDGDADIKEDVEFFGLIAVKGTVYTFDDVRIYGGLVGGQDVNIENADFVQYSSCALSRALSEVGGGGAMLQPLSTRPWSSFLR